jgi:hypothetical protein
MLYIIKNSNKILDVYLILILKIVKVPITQPHGVESGLRAEPVYRCFKERIGMDLSISKT